MNNAGGLCHLQSELTRGKLTAGVIISAEAGD